MASLRSKRKRRALTPLSPNVRRRISSPIPSFLTTKDEQDVGPSKAHKSARAASNEDSPYEPSSAAADTEEGSCFSGHDADSGDDIFHTDDEAQPGMDEDEDEDEYDDSILQSLADDARNAALPDDHQHQGSAKNKAIEDSSSDSSRPSPRPHDLQWIAQFSDGEPLPLVARHIVNFRRLMRGMIRSLKGIADRLEGDETLEELDDPGQAEWERLRQRHLSQSTINLLREDTTDEIMRDVVQSVPLVVQSLLGKPDLRAVDLLRLPVMDTGLWAYGVYLGIVTPEDKPEDPEGLYTGSSAQKAYGILGRCKAHVYYVSGQKPPPYPCRFYDFAREPGMDTCFRQLAVFPMNQHNRDATRLLEGLLMTYLDTAESDWACQTSYETVRSETGWYASTRRADRALPTFPGLRAGNRDECGNCGKQRPPGSNGQTGWYSYAEKSRCKPCRTWTLHKGGERPKNLPKPIRKYHCAKCKAPRPDNFVELGWTKFNIPHANIRCPDCKDTSKIVHHTGDCSQCGRVRGKRLKGHCRYEGGVFYSKGPASICAACYERGKRAERKERHERIQAGLEEESDDDYVCAGCGESRPTDYIALGWTKRVRPRSAIKCPKCRGFVRVRTGKKPLVENKGDCSKCGHVRGARLPSAYSHAMTRYEGGVFYGKGADSLCSKCYKRDLKKRKQDTSSNDKSGQPKKEELSGDCTECGRVRGPKDPNKRYGKWEGGYFYGTGPTSLCIKCYKMKRNNENSARMKRDQDDSGPSNHGHGKGST
ncbi:hypothetical protein LIA77_04047 [Sarocladium implicatum]|nr:hypothetical protein LIA77_04047 [Sarocladium implicatum]